jgi:hypothetical protein
MYNGNNNIYDNQFELNTLISNQIDLNDESYQSWLKTTTKVMEQSVIQDNLKSVTEPISITELNEIIIE